MYITVKTVKRNLGFKGLEISDLLIAFPFVAIFLILFCFTKIKLIGLAILVIGLFFLIPITVSQKNRMYKILKLVIDYLKRKKEFIFFKENKKEKGGLNEIIKKTIKI